MPRSVHKVTQGTEAVAQATHIVGANQSLGT